MFICRSIFFIALGLSAGFLNAQIPVDIRVIDAYSKIACQNALVEIAALKGGKPVFSGVSDDSGFVFTILQTATSYRIRFVKDGYADQQDTLVTTHQALSYLAVLYDRHPRQKPLPEANNSVALPRIEPEKAAPKTAAKTAPETTSTPKGCGWAILLANPEKPLPADHWLWDRFKLQTAGGPGGSPAYITGFTHRKKDLMLNWQQNFVSRYPGTVVIRLKNGSFSVPDKI